MVMCSSVIPIGIGCSGRVVGIDDLLTVVSCLMIDEV